MDCIAHRGFAGVNPENTLTALRRAVDSGADAVEIDVRRCGSGELVVVHDERVDRISETTGLVADLSSAALAGLDVLGTGEGVPTLERALGIVPDDVRVNVELKETGLARDALGVVEEHDNPVVFSSFAVEPLDVAGECGSVPTALLVAEEPDAGLATARRLECRALHPHWDLCARPFLDTCRSAGLAVNAWTVRSSAVADSLAALGVDGLIADAPAHCR